MVMQAHEDCFDGGNEVSCSLLAAISQERLNSPQSWNNLERSLMDCLAGKLDDVQPRRKSVQFRSPLVETNLYVPESSYYRIGSAKLVHLNPH
jgi:hypothetical protein